MDRNRREYAKVLTADEYRRLVTALDATAPERVLIQTTRQRLGLSQEATAKRAGYTRQRVGDIESGIQIMSGRPIAIGVPALALARIAHAIGITADQLAPYQDPETGQMIDRAAVVDISEPGEPRRMRRVGRADAAARLRALWPDDADPVLTDPGMPGEYVEMLRLYRLLGTDDREQSRAYARMHVQWQLDRIDHQGKSDPPIGLAS
jgi:transcriptional regulator with XRE-family HTH domain